jgi:hypothetical protein
VVINKLLDQLEQSAILILFWFIGIFYCVQNWNMTMNVNYFSFLLIAALISIPLPILAEMSEAQQNRLQCEQEREERLAPLREQEIENCVKNRSSREDCERKYQDFGNSGRTVTGSYRARMFDDLPSCIAAREAEAAEEAAKCAERKKGEGHRDTVPGKTRDSSTGTAERGSATGTTKRDTKPGKKRDIK